MDAWINFEFTVFGVCEQLLLALRPATAPITTSISTPISSKILVCLQRQICER